MDFTLSAEQELIRDTAREFCEREIVPYSREWDRTETMDRGIVAKLAKIGFLGCALPEGGAWVSTLSVLPVMGGARPRRLLVRGLSPSTTPAGKTTRSGGRRSREWLPQLADGQALGLRPDGTRLGSDPASLVTKAGGATATGHLRLEDLHHARLVVRRARVRARTRGPRGITFPRPWPHAASAPAASRAS
jgi:alkylation response protein AidB-like acyl-CoA dehydrogenase